MEAGELGAQGHSHLHKSTDLINTGEGMGNSWGGNGKQFPCFLFSAMKLFVFLSSFL